MPTPTTTYAFDLPTVGGDDDNWGDLNNDNWTLTDLLFTNSFDLAGAPANSLGFLKSTLIPNPITARVEISHADRPQLTVERADNTVNASIRYKGVTGTGVEAGLGDAGIFAVGPDGSLAAADALRKFWVDTSTGNITATGSITGASVAAASATHSGTMTANKVTLSGGVVATATDLSKGIQFDTQFGINYRTSILGLAVSSIGKVSVGVAGTEVAYFDSAGINGLASASQLNRGTVPSARLNGSYTAIIELATEGDIDCGGSIIASGPVLAEEFCFASDTDTGMQNGGANIITWQTAGVLRMTLTSGGLTLNSGDFAGNGASLTDLDAGAIETGTLNTNRLSTSTAADDWVADRIATFSHGQLGSYAFLQRTDAGSTPVGDEVAGSGLTYAGVSSTGEIAGSGSPSGTWKAMGRFPTGHTRPATIWLRVA